MKNSERELEYIKKRIQACERKMKVVNAEKAFQCGFELMQEIKKPVLLLIEENVRSNDIIKTCENLVELLIRTGSTSFREKPSETVQLSTLLNYCCFLLEEFNLRKEIADFLYDTYSEWYSIEET